MRSMTWWRAGLVLLFGLCLPAVLAPAASAQTEPRFDALVFSKTTGFRHTEAIEAGKVAIRELAVEHNFRVDETEDSGQFTERNLARYDVVVMLHPDGQNVLLDAEEVAFERYIQRGGGVVGIHAASNMNRDWPWWQDLLGGALFANHPPIQTATMHVEDRNHPATAHLPADWEWTDEWYNFTADPRSNDAHVVLSVDESTYSGGTMGEGHPIAWCSDFDGGRTFYTAIGHSASHYQDELFRGHIRGAIEWAAGVAQGKKKPCGPARAGIPSDSSFDKVTLDAGTENPMELAVAPDLKVYYVELAGAVKVWEPETSQTRVIGNIPVHRGNENGLLGLALDPRFQTNRRLYVFYSAPPQEGPTGFQHLSRFTLDADGDLDMSSERVLLRIPHQRLICCHSAGSLAFGPGGQLYISTGDDTTPFETNSYAPIDDDVLRNNVPGDPDNDANKAYDARRTSGNTNDLRGKILRIVPKDNPTGTPGPGNTYDIPTGNLFGLAGRFPGVEGQTLPEIYTMGHRNPFRIAVDQETGWLYNGEVGPDANNDSATRGPRGYDELNQIRQAGNMGWPYCLAADYTTPDPLDSFAYRDWTYPSGPAGDAFDCSGAPGGGPVNESRYNTGLAQTPPITPALLYWPYTPYPSGFPFPDVPAGPGRTAIAGPIYHFQGSNPAENKFPAFYDDKVFFADWSRDWIATLTLDAQGRAAKVDRFMGNTRFRAPHDMAMGPDGSLYLLEWGEAFNFAGGGINRDSGLYRIDYAKGRRTPVARATADPSSGPAPLTVEFSSEGTEDLDGDEITLEWNFGDGSSSTESNPTHTYTSPGAYTAQLRVTDSTGKVGTATVTIQVGNTRPTVAIEFPEDGGFVDWGDEVNYRITVTDPEDTTIACDRVRLQLGLLHDAGGGASHVHPGTSQTGCEGTFGVQPDPGHDAGALLMQVVTATYTDSGGQPGSQPLEGGVTHRLWPKTIQAEHFNDQQGLSVVDNNTARGFFRVQSVTVGDWLYFEPMNFRNIDSVSVRYSAGSTAGGRLDLRLDAPDGPVVSTLELGPTGGGNTYNDVVAPIAPTTGTHRVYLTFAQRTGGPTSNLFNLDELTFIGQGVAGG